jgi:hypothetical protein
MTDKEWLTCEDPMRLLAALPAGASERKFRLVVCELLRYDRTVTNPNAVRSITIGEQFADGLVTEDEVRAFSRATLREGVAEEWSALTSDSRESIRIYISSHSSYTARQLPPLLREMFGNPFRPATVDPAWLTSTVVALAEGIYAERAFDRMPILADALQDAGCDNDAILAHCRDTSLMHVRGCWVIDLLTGRA